jgi:hypothetical protein
MTFNDLLRLEPALKALLAEAFFHHATASTGFCANAVWYGYPGHQPGLKRRLLELVGWTARCPRLRCSEAYDVAYETIYHALPECNHEGMCPGGW